MFAKINDPVKIVQPELQGLDSVQKLLTGERSLHETHKLGYRTGFQSEGIVRNGQLQIDRCRKSFFEFQDWKYKTLEASTKASTTPLLTIVSEFGELD